MRSNRFGYHVGWCNYTNRDKKMFGIVSSKISECRRYNEDRMKNEDNKVDRFNCPDYGRYIYAIGNSVGVGDAEKVKIYYLTYKDEWTIEEKEKFLKVLSNFIHSIDELDNLEHISFRQKRSTDNSRKRKKYDLEEELRKIDEEFAQN